MLGFFFFQFVLRTWLSRLWSLKKLTLKTQSHLFLNVSLASHPGSGFLPSRFCWALYDQPCLNSLHSSLQATLQPSRIHPLTAWNTKSVCFSNPCHDPNHLHPSSPNSDLLSLTPYHFQRWQDRSLQQNFSGIFLSIGWKGIFAPSQVSCSAPTDFTPRQVLPRRDLFLAESWSSLAEGFARPTQSKSSSPAPAKLWEFSSLQQSGRLTLRVKGLLCWYQLVTIPWKFPNSSSITIHTVILIGTARRSKLWENVCSVLRGDVGSHQCSWHSWTWVVGTALNSGINTTSQAFPGSKDAGLKTLRYRQFPKMAVHTQSTVLIPEISR